MKWYLFALSNYAGFTGRARRKEYWFFALFNVVFLLLAILLDNILGSNIPDLPYGVFYFIYMIVIFLPALALTARRLHDVGKSGWMMLVSFIPLIGGVWLLVLMLTDGEKGPNKYGLDPKAETALTQ